MSRISDEQIAEARNVDLLSWLLKHEPLSVRKCGVNEYCLAEHDSFKMSNGRWFWFSQGFGGYGALDFLVKVRGIGFAEAVQSLTYGTPPPYTQEKTLSPKIIPAKQAKPFALPPPSANNDRVYAYLRGRGIGKDIINRCVRAGILYESKAHRCVFVGKDGDIPRFACERGTADDCKRDVPGSSKRFSFCLPPSTLDGGRNLAVFESAIDCIAHFEIHRLGQTGWDGYRLALGGVGSAALDGFMERHTDIENVQLCLDADQAGINAAKRITAELLSDKRFARTKICVAPPPLGKDYSDCLQAIHETNKAKTITDRQRAVFSM